MRCGSSNHIRKLTQIQSKQNFEDEFPSGREIIYQPRGGRDSECSRGLDSDFLKQAEFEELESKIRQEEIERQQKA